MSLQNKTVPGSESTGGPPPLANARRILVVGSGGAGKSTFARRLAAISGLPVVHLDREYWRPGWVPMPRDEWERRVEELCDGDRWILDGNFGGTLAARAKRCDAVVFFDFMRITCLWGASKRIALRRWLARPDMADGCPERWDFSFLKWVWGYPNSGWPRVVQAIEGAPHAEIVVLKSRRQVRRLLRSYPVHGGTAVRHEIV